MRKYLPILVFAVFLTGSLSAQLLPPLGAQRAGISAMTFLKIDVSPRAAGMGGASICLPGDGYSTQINPASVMEMDNLNVTAGNTFWVAGINHSFASVSKPFGRIGSFGLSVATLNTGKMERRTEFQPNGTGEYFYASNTAVGLTYSRRLTEMFSFGVTGKFVNETLAEYQANTAVIDMGFKYRVDWQDLNFGVMLQSFGFNSKLKGDYSPNTFDPKPVTLESYPAPTMFQLGASMKPWKNDTTNSSLLVALQLNHPNDNAENIRIGAEYCYREILFVRAGYKVNVKDQNLPSAGFGLRTRVGRHPMQLDYSVDPTIWLGWIHRVGLSFTLNPPQDREPAIDSMTEE